MVMLLVHCRTASTATAGGRSPCAEKKLIGFFSFYKLLEEQEKLVFYSCFFLNVQKVCQCFLTICLQHGDILFTYCHDFFGDDRRSTASTDY